MQTCCLFYCVLLASHSVILHSTLKQNSLCPGDQVATFTCRAVGTDLTWVIGDDTMSYNANAQVGALRSNAPGDVTCMLMRVDDREDNGRASRVSVLTINRRLYSDESVTVKCHNGSSEFGESRTFRRRSAGWNDRFFLMLYI